MFIMFGSKLFFPWFFAGLLLFKVFSVSLLTVSLLAVSLLTVSLLTLFADDGSQAPAS